MKTLIALLCALPLSAHAAYPSFKCDVRTGYASRNSSYTLTATTATAEEAKYFQPTEAVFILMAELPDFTSRDIASTESFATVDDKPIPVKQRYTVEPIRMICHGAATNPYMKDCEQAENQRVILKGQTDGIEYVFSDESRNTFRIGETVQRRLDYKGGTQDLTSRDFDIEFHGQLATGRLARYTSHRSGDPKDCQLLP